MMNCPQCKATLPDGAARCQFCGATFAPTVPVRNTESGTPDYSVPYKWIWPVYYAISAWWIFNGLYAIGQTFLSKDPFSFWGIIILIIGIFTALVGLGLILRIELARGVVNIICFLQIVRGLGYFVGGFAATFASGLFGALFMIYALLEIALAVLMIFVLGETESRAADF